MHPVCTKLKEFVPNRLLAHWTRYRRTGSYVMETEVHVYAFSMAANVLLSFFPFLLVMTSLCRHVFHWQAAEDSIYLALRDVFAGETGIFLVRNLRDAVDRRGAFQVLSVLLLLFAANGIFEPLEVALNRTWGIAKNRSFFRNQLVSFGLVFVCGTLILISVMLTAYSQELWRTAGFQPNPFTEWMNIAIFKAAVVPVTILALLLTYWMLPNAKVPLTPLIPVSIVVAVALEALKTLNALIWPFLRIKLEKEYGPFVNSATILLWSFFASMIVLAGAEWAARKPDPETPVPL